MIVCSKCQQPNPDSANFCMACGQALPQVEKETEAGPKHFNLAGLNLLMLSLVGSIALSLVLIMVFRLPVFFLAAFLPLLWYRKKRD